MTTDVIIQQRGSTLREDHLIPKIPARGGSAMDITKDLVVWDSRFELGINKIDEQHKHLVEICNELFRGCLLGKDESETYFRKALKEAVNYVLLHFSDEEKILIYYKYPEFTKHKTEHEKFIKQILHEANEFEKGSSFVPNQFARFLRDWILQHIAIEDKKYAAYILEVQKARSQ